MFTSHKHFNHLGLLVARLVGGGLLALHGFQKLQNPNGFIGGLKEMGAPLPDVTGWLLILGEAGLGSLIALGLFTRLAGLLSIAMFAGVYLQVYAPGGVFTAGEGGNGLNGEDVLMYMVLGAVWASVGAGNFSLDRLIGGAFSGKGGKRADNAAESSAESSTDRTASLA